MWEPRTIRLLAQCDADAAAFEQARPLSAGVLAKIRHQLRITLTYTSNAIEGNTLSLRETMVVLEGQTIQGKPLRDHLEAVDHAEAFAFVWSLAETDHPVTAADVRSLHALVVRRSLPDEAGRWRTTGVRIAGSAHIPPDPIAVPSLMEQWIAQWKQASSLHPIVRAARLHSDFVSIHPFLDGNGRTARLLTNLDLIRHGHRPALLLPNERLQYYDALEASRAGHWDPLIQHLAAAIHRGFVECWQPYLPWTPEPLEPAPPPSP